MQKSGKTLLLLLLLLFSTFLLAQELTQDLDIFRSTITKEFAAAAGGRLVIQNTMADIEVMSWHKAVVQIQEHLIMDVYTREEARAIVEKMTGAVSKSGNDIVLTSAPARPWVQRRYNVLVPEKFQLDIKILGGSIIAKSISGPLELATTSGDIKINRISGKTNLRTAGGNLEVREVTGTVDAYTAAGNIVLEDISEVCQARTAGGTIWLRNAQKSVILETSSGDIITRDTIGNLTAKTAGGIIKVNTVKGKAELFTSGGDIFLENVEGSITGETSGGDIDARGIAGELSVLTSAGNISLIGVKGAARAVSHSGDIHLVMTLEDFTRKHELDLTTNNGDIAVTIPAKLPANITAEIHLAGENESWRGFNIFSDFELSKKLVNNGLILKSIGRINGGGDEIFLKANYGNIYIRRSH